MNLKEAFRFQNKLQRLMDQAEEILSQRQNVLKVETTYLRKKVMPESENEVIVDEPSTEFSEQINQLADFLLHLLDERTLLAAAIHGAKAGLDIDMDTQAGLNGTRQSIAGVLRGMANLRSSQVLISGGGTGYRFNTDGNQVSYRCDIKKVTTIHFDRNKIRRMATELNQRADAISTQLDGCLVNTQVAYQPPFDVNDTFADVFEQYCHGLATA